MGLLKPVAGDRIGDRYDEEADARGYEDCVQHGDFSDP